jgi:DNA-binding XRE family transcriptional regulator
MTSAQTAQRDTTQRTRNPRRETDLRKELFEGISQHSLSIAQAVRLMQRLSGLTQPEFAKHRGVSTRVLKEIMAGKANPTMETLNRIGAVFGVQVGWIPMESAPIATIRSQRPRQTPAPEPAPISTEPGPASDPR